MTTAGILKRPLGLAAPIAFADSSRAGDVADASAVSAEATTRPPRAAREFALALVCVAERLTIVSVGYRLHRYRQRDLDRALQAERLRA